MKNKEDELNNLRIENEIKKMKLSLSMEQISSPHPKINYPLNSKGCGWIRCKNLKMPIQKAKGF